MKTIVIAGGNSGVGLQAAREILAEGNRVILLGRDKRKGEDAIASFGAARDRATFLSVDLSTHDGVRDAARRVNALTDRIDGLVHSAAVFATKDIRTVDGLNLFFELSYLSRYHLTQLLLPKLLLSDRPRVVMLIATFEEVPKLDPKLFPHFEGFTFLTAVPQVNGASMYYADYLMKTHPKIFAGCVSPGFVRTGIFREAPWFFKAFVALTAPFRANSVETAAHNVVEAVLRGEGMSAFNWPKPGDFQHKFAISVDSAIQNAVIGSSRDVTGA
ncbi:SDR family NAD(P)-dependent oxidoreductase [Granulicella sp. S156]|uniref:SDR family NAD(P)-dependent oxidoreductase n=1 Tax=Granulicella sp. S156 TaxID=1747224 RepID=UPI00131D5226|nr:SDR family NAD(P)-dependent oxidoreductase [Granulicella sp. S156]